MQMVTIGKLAVFEEQQNFKAKFVINDQMLLMIKKAYFCEVVSP